MTVNRLECQQRTHIGLIRETNQDCLDCDAAQGVMVLADGMGGHRAGEIAARIAVDTVMAALLPVQQSDVADRLESQLWVGQAAETANRAVFSAMGRDPALTGMATTLVLALFRGDRVFHAHVGDSRLYCLRDGRLRCLTRDHSLVQQLLDNGLFGSREEINEAGIGDNILTRGIGLDAEVEVDVGDQRLHAGDLYLMCSDGLCGKVPDADIQDILLRYVSLDRMADELIEAALAAGGRDNISLIVARPDL